MPENRYRQQWQVLSSDGERTYTVSLTLDDQWQCSCVGWTRHTPRRDCRHIKDQKAKSSIGPAKPQAEVKAAAMTAKAALKSGADPDEVAAVARAKREEVQSKKAAKLGKIRYGFQLLETFEPADVAHGRWIAEPKLDGELCLGIDGRLILRSGRDATNRFPEIAKVTDAVLVGELCVFDEATGLTVFEKIQERNMDNETKIRLLSRERPAKFVVFDMLEYQGQPMDTEPFELRRRTLEGYFKTHSLKNVQLIEQIPIDNGNGYAENVRRLVDAMGRLGGEGIVIKSLDAPWLARRNRGSLKAKCWKEMEADIIAHGPTGIGDGYTITILVKGREQVVNLGDHRMRELVKAGAKRVELKYLSENAGALRFPSVRRLVGN